MSPIYLLLLSMLCAMVLSPAADTGHSAAPEKLKTVRLRVYGFPKSKSGAV